MKFLHKIFITTLVASSLFAQPLIAQEIINPSTAIKGRSFAIVVDQQTFQYCKEDILKYQAAVEKEGLPTFIVSHAWKAPEEVKKQILKLYKNKQLEGVVFVGDIPIPMIRKAQFLATAFKMDEKYDIKDSSIPSDRFYDDFDLTFDFLQKDKNSPLLFYYNLGVNSTNKIKSDIYSARIKPIATSNKDKYKQVSAYLQKVVKAKAEQNQVDNVMAYLGDGTLSNSLVAWSPEMFRLEEQFPNVFKRSTQAQVFRFDTWNFPKHELINQFRRDDLDIAFIHEHGMTDRMYISGEYATNNVADHIEGIKRQLIKLAQRDIKDESSRQNFLKNYIAKYQLDSTIITDYNSANIKEKDSLRTIDQGINAYEIDAIQPNVRLTVFDACYNGDFREEDYIAGRFIFSEGKSLLALANSVSILQDVNTPHLIGTLGQGVNIGRWAQYNHVLESHVFGDPTYTFTPTTNEQLLAITSEKDNKKLIEQFGKTTSSEAKNLILTQLYWNNYPDLAKIVEQEYNKSPYSTTRYTCVHLANLIGGSLQFNLLTKGTKDADEFIRRHSINVISTIGDPKYIPYLVEAYIENQHASRILFNVENALHSFQKDAIKAIAEQKFGEAHFIHKEEVKNKFITNQSSGFYAEIDKGIFDPESKYRKLSINALKNVNYHPSVDKYIEFVRNSKEDLELRIAMLQSLAWFGNSYRKDEIINACKELMVDTRHPKKLRDEAQRTLNTIK